MAKALLIAFITIWGLVFTVSGQNVGKHSFAETEDTLITAYEDNADSTVYTGMQRMLNGLQPISYLAPLMKFWPQEPVRDLHLGEGMNGYIIKVSESRYQERQRINKTRKK
jgi:hypothetical protein